MKKYLAASENFASLENNNNTMYLYQQNTEICIELLNKRFSPERRYGFSVCETTLKLNLLEKKNLFHVAFYITTPNVHFPLCKRDMVGLTPLGNSQLLHATHSSYEPIDCMYYRILIFILPFFTS